MARSPAPDPSSSRPARLWIEPLAPRWDGEKAFPRDEVLALGALGLFGVAIPEEWGGAGMDCTACAIACEEISAGDGATCTIVMKRAGMGWSHTTEPLPLM